MRIPEIKLYEYLIGNLTGQEAGEVEAWIQESDENQKIFNQMKSIYDHSEIAESTFKPDVDVAWDKVASATMPAQKQLFMTSFYKVAAAIVLVAGLAYVAVQGYWSDEYQIVVTGNDQQKEVMLADGTVVTLNENTEFKYPKEFNGDEREVLLNGQAFFDVARDEAKPFQIIGSQTTVEVLGTSFDLISRINQSNINVVSGKVAFTSNANEEHQLILVKGQSASMTNNTMVNEGEMNINSLAWRTDVLVFESTPLAEVVEVLNEHFEVNITYDEQIAKCLITSTFEKQELKEILEILFAISKIENTKEGNEIKLSGPGC